MGLQEILYLSRFSLDLPVGFLQFLQSEYGIQMRHRFPPRCWPSQIRLLCSHSLQWGLWRGDHYLPEVLRIQGLPHNSKYLKRNVMNLILTLFHISRPIPVKLLTTLYQNFLSKND